MMHLTPSEKKILDFVKEYAQQSRTDGVIQKELAQELGMVFSTYKRSCQTLVETGIVEKIRKPKNRIHFVLLFKSFC